MRYREHPSDHRWEMGRPYSYGPLDISVIEPPDDDGKAKKGVPFGFARVLPRDEAEPLFWEGQGL